MGRYNLPAVLRALREPGRLVGEYRRIGIKANRLLSTDSRGFQMMEADWDVLVILDACRVDLFDEESHLDGSTTVINSGASQSMEFMETHFKNETYHDTVYISANPYTSNLDPNIFHEIINVYETEWDDALGTIAPDSVANAAIDASREYPAKRLVVHFMQPHYPFIGKAGRSLDTGDLPEGNDVWTLLQNLRCSVDKETVWKAYAENYRLAENEVQRLESQVVGKTIVTADHGNLVGERLSPIPVKAFGHPHRVDHEALRMVPWHQMPTEGRRKTDADPPKESNLKTSTSVEEKLRALGYR